MLRKIVCYATSPARRAGSSRSRHLVMRTAGGVSSRTIDEKTLIFLVLEEGVCAPPTSRIIENVMIPKSLGGSEVMGAPQPSQKIIDNMLIFIVFGEVGGDGLGFPRFLLHQGNHKKCMDI